MMVWLAGRNGFAAEGATDAPVMRFLGFDGGTLPVNKEGATYPNQYRPEGNTTAKLPLAGKRGVHLAIRPENAKLFSQIALPVKAR